MKETDRQENLENYLRYLFLIRFRYNFQAISNLLELYQNDSYFKIPIFLILRACLSDLLTFFYFVHTIKKNYPNSNTINSLIYSYLVDHLHRIKTHMYRKLERDEINNKKYDEYWNIIKSKFSDFFDSNSNLIEKVTPNFSEIYEILKQNTNLICIANAYHLYDYLSKFEHVGVLTYEMQEFHKVQDNFDKGSIMQSLSILIDGANFIVNSLKNKS